MQGRHPIPIIKNCSAQSLLRFDLEDRKNCQFRRNSSSRNTKPPPDSLGAQLISLQSFCLDSQIDSEQFAPTGLSPRDQLLLNPGVKLNRSTHTQFFLNSHRKPKQIRLSENKKSSLLQRGKSECTEARAKRLNGFGSPQITLGPGYNNIRRSLSNRNLLKINKSPRRYHSAREIILGSRRPTKINSPKIV